MSNRIKNNLKNLVGQTLNQYYSKVKPTISDLRYKQEYQNRIIECMVGEVDDNYITTPETDNPMTKLEHSKEGLVKVPTVKGKTILVDAEGNETDTPAEGCKLLSVGEQEDNKLIILSKNKNIWNWNDLRSQEGGDDPNLHKRFSGILDKINNDEYSITPSPSSWYEQGIFSTPIYLKKGDSISFSGVAKGCRNVTMYELNDFLKPIADVVQYDENSSEYKSFSISSTVEKDGYYLGRFWISSNCKAYIRDLQLEISPSSTNYIEPKKHKTEILLNEPLRSLPNGVCDEIVGNQLIRRVGLKVLTTKNCKWSSWNVRESDTLFFCHAGYYFENAKTFKIENCRSNRFEFRKTFGNVNDGETEHFGNYMTNPHIAISKTHATSLSEVAEYFDNNLFQVLYELEEPIIEELPSGITIQGFDDTTMYIENSITPTVSYGYNALIPYKEELSNQKEEVEVNTLDIENNIIPYLMDMEFNLMTMEDK